MEKVNRGDIAINKPRNDRCDTCASFKNELSDEVAFGQHKEKWLRATATIVKDIDHAARENNVTLVIAMDAQAMLQCHKLTASALYHKSKVCVHNFS